MIVPFALRLCAFMALKGQTLAGNNVQDSAVTALDELVANDPQPFIIVSTDEQQVTLTGLDVTSGMRSCDIVLDIAVASSATLPNGEIEVAIPPTDSGLELTVNLITRQALRALFEPNSGGEWGKMFRRIATVVRSIQTRRGAGTKGVRFAAAQLVIVADTIHEPAFGFPPSDIWADFMALVAATPDIAPQLPLLNAIFVGDELPEWRRIISLLGISDGTADMIGILPHGDEPLESMETVPGGWVVDAEAVAENVPDAPDGE